MYEEFYGLRCKPFQLNPDPSFYFASKQHRRAKAYLEYGILRNEGFIVVTGEIGAGKTTLVRGLMDSLDASKVVAAQLVSTQLDAEDMLRMVCAAFGVQTKNISKADLLMTLEVFFVSQAGQGKRCLLVVDEAQNLTPRAVEELRMLSNFQFGDHALLQSFLVGQPEFRAILQDPSMQQLKQRVIAACHIGPLDAEETKEYISHRLKISGAPKEPIFEESAVAIISNISNGIPRKINLICDRLLLQGFLNNKFSISEQDVQQVWQEIDEEYGNNVGDGSGSLASADGSDSRANRETIRSHADHKDKASEGQLEQYSSEERARWLRVEQSVSRIEQATREILLALQKDHISSANQSDDSY